jgi:tetratricopeptide (TPR) repeat protein
MTAALLVWAVCVAGGPAAADLAADEESCETETDPAPGIAACTRVIDALSAPRAKDAWAFINRGLSYRDSSDYRRAVEDFTTAIRLDPKDPGGPYHRALVYNDLAEYALALEDLNRAEQLDGEDPDVYNARGMVYTDTGRYAEALVQFDRAIDLDDDEKFHHNNRAVALTELGRCEDALDAAEEALDLDDEYGNAIVNRGVALACLGRRAEAMEQFRRATSLYPKNPYVTNAIAWKLSKSDRPGFRGDPFPLEMAQRTVALSDTHAFHDTLAAALANAGQFAEAAAEEKRALEMSRAAGETGFEAQYERRLALYENGKVLIE